MKLKKSSSSQILKSEQHQEYSSSPCRNQEGTSNQQPESLIVSLLSPPSKSISHCRSDASGGSHSNKQSAMSSKKKTKLITHPENALPYFQLGKTQNLSLAGPIQNRNDNAIGF